MDKILLIDGHSILNRAYYGIPLLTNNEGIHTNAVYGFVNIMLKALEDEKADYIAVAFDLKTKTFRHKMFSEYKGTRKPMPVELHEQVPIIQDVLRAMTIPVITLEGYEADDILGTLAKRCQKDGFSVSVLSGDRDLLQLADENIKIRLPKTIKGKTEIENYYPTDVVTKYQVTPLEFIDLKALMGDTSDNIPGVPGIGEKTATAIITKYHSIENAHEHVEEITPTKAKNNMAEYYDMAVMSKTLATIEINAPVEFNVQDAHIDNLFTTEAYDKFSKLELKTLLKYFKSTEVQEISDIDYEIVNDYLYADRIFNDCIKAEKAGISIACDKNTIFGAAISFNGKKAYFVACENFITSDYLIDNLKKLSRLCHLYVIGLKKCVDYLSDDISDNIDDIEIMAYLNNPVKESYMYDDISSEYLSVNYPGRTMLAGKKTDELLFNEDIDILARIHSIDAIVAYSSFDNVSKKLAANGMKQVYDEIELPLIYVLRSMEREGIRVDKESLKKYGDELVGRIEELEKSIYQKTGFKFNINSPKQLGEILFDPDKMGLPSGKKTKTGYSTSADVLEKLASEYPVVNDILEYRTLTKLKSTYADGLYDYIKQDGRIHGTFNQTITATGRISSTEPNLQNIPIRMELGRLIRKVFIPKAGYVFIDADYSQIELRLLAHMSGDENLINAYNEDRDIHRITASKVFKTPLNEVTSTQRSNAKAVNFGIVYGISSFGLSRDLSISKTEAKEYIDEYFKTYPMIKNYLDGLIESTKENGYSETLYGRRRPIPEIQSSNFMQRQFGERIAMNSPLQGTAADIIKIAMINVYKRLQSEHLKSKLILQIHDELLIETAEDEEEAVNRILNEEMKGAASLKVALEIDVHLGTNWYDAK